MDGLPPEIPARAQRTLRQPIGCVGVGLHTGRRVSLTLHPAPVNSGIRFRRTDMAAEVAARFDRVIDTRLCTVLSPEGRPEVRIGTVEHVMAALAGCGVDNAVVELDGPEVPILDGSAAPFVFLIGCAGIVAQAVQRRSIRIRRTVRVTEGEAEAILMPADAGFAIDVSIDFADAAIGRQRLEWQASDAEFRAGLSHARTFARAADIAALRAAGLARGGSLENAVVVDGDRVLNPAGLRMADEFVRHKVLDALGDLALAGAPLVGRFIGRRSGHGVNNRVLRALFADAANWAPLELQDLPMAAAAG